MNQEEKLIKIMKAKYPNIKEEDIEMSFCPYRVCPVGAHIDHQKGNVTGFAIDKGIKCLYAKTSSHLFEATSLNFPGTKGGSIVNIGEPQKDWADYLRGTAKILNEKYDISEGIYCLIEGELPIGGISSSAAVIIAFAQSLCKANQIELSDEEMIKLVQEVENKYIGVNSGLLDQSCETLSKKDHLLYLDIQNNTHKLIEKSPKMDPYEIAIIFSGVKRTLVGSAYNTRVDELKSASYCLKAFSGMTYGKYTDSVLRDVDRTIYEEYKNRLPENFQKRAEHYYTEMERVERGVKAWSEGNIEEFGRISFESGDSSIHNYEAGSKELITIHEIMKQTDGIYGGRFSGAGFKGCCLALIDPSYEQTIKEEITKKYLEEFPEYKDSFGIYYCNTSDGVNLGKVEVKR
ncbi:MAG: GHMP kinase [Bacilli bacterium]|nr:GHMP kinase [Bacilli bacterium]